MQFQHQVDKIIAVLRERRPNLLISKKVITHRLNDAAIWYRSGRRTQESGQAPGLGKIQKTLAGAAAHLRKAVEALGIDRKRIEDGPEPSVIRELIEYELRGHDDPERRLREYIVEVWALAKAMDKAAEVISRRPNSPAMDLITEDETNDSDSVVSTVFREQHRWRTGAARNAALNGFIGTVMVLWFDATGNELAVSLASDKGRAPGKPTGRAIEFLRLCQELVGESVSDEGHRERVRNLKKPM